jgi:hypothetical protein
MHAQLNIMGVVPVRIQMQLAVEGSGERLHERIGLPGGGIALQDVGNAQPPSFHRLCRRVRQARGAEALSLDGGGRHDVGEQRAVLLAHVGRGNAHVLLLRCRTLGLMPEAGRFFQGLQLLQRSCSRDARLKRGAQR